MLAELRSRERDIAALCRRFHVRKLDVFGSAARGSDFDADRSDVDLLVEFEPEHAPPRLRDYLALREAFATLVGHPVDLVMASAVRNPFIQASIDRDRERVYGA